MHAQTAPAILGYRNLGTDIATTCLKAEIGTKARSSDFRAQSAPPLPVIHGNGMDEREEEKKGRPPPAPMINPDDGPQRW